MVAPALEMRFLQVKMERTESAVTKNYLEIDLFA